MPISIHFLNIIFFVSLGLVCLNEISIEIRGAGKARHKGDNLTGWLINAVILVCLVVGLTANNRFWPIDRFDFDTRFKIILSLAFIWAGLIVRFLAVRSLGGFFQPVISLQPGHRLVKRGLYKNIRHPSYLGILLIFLGLFCRLNSWLVLPLLVLVIFAYWRRIGQEERFLRIFFGSEYDEYIKKTKRIIPHLY